MGEIADDMISGKCCALCGVYFIDKDTKDDVMMKMYEHGHPVACNDCHSPNCGYEKQDKNAIEL